MSEDIQINYCSQLDPAENCPSLYIEIGYELMSRYTALIMGQQMRQMKVDSFKGKQTNKQNLLYNVDSARFLKKKKKR